MRLRDRFFRRSTADLMMGPLGILAAGAGAAVGILVGLPALGAIGAGAAAWAGRVLIGLPREPGRPKLDIRGLREPWKRSVSEADRARREFELAIDRIEEGPVREHMASIGGRIDSGVESIIAVARQAQTLEDARVRIDVARAASDLATLRQDPTTPGRPSLVRTMESIEAQLATAERLDRQLHQAREELGLLDARLDEAVARGLELSARRGEVDLGTLDREIDDMVMEMEALRQALDATAEVDPSESPEGGSTPAVG